MARTRKAAPQTTEVTEQQTDTAVSATESNSTPAMPIEPTNENARQEELAEVEQRAGVIEPTGTETLQDHFDAISAAVKAAGGDVETGSSYQLPEPGLTAEQLYIGKLAAQLIAPNHHNMAPEHIEARCTEALEKAEVLLATLKARYNK